MRVDIWSDIVCPWCAIGKAHFDSALRAFEHADEVEVVWRSFELDPNAPREARPIAQELARKYGKSPVEVDQMLASTTERAASVGLEFHFDKARGGNTFDAHRLIHLAHQHGVQDEMKQRFLRAYFTEGEAIGLPEVLSRLAIEVGLSAEDVARVLESDDFAEAVRADETHARALGASGVPFFVIDNRYGLSGAQPPEVMLHALREAWSTRTPLLSVNTVGEACGPDDNC